LHFSTFIYNEQVLNIVIFSKYFGYTVSISPITKCRVGEIDTIILKFLHGVKKHPSTGIYNAIMHCIAYTQSPSFLFSCVICLC